MIKFFSMCALLLWFRFLTELHRSALCVGRQTKLRVTDQRGKGRRMERNVKLSAAKNQNWMQKIIFMLRLHKDERERSFFWSAKSGMSTHNLSILIHMWIRYRVESGAEERKIRIELNSNLPHATYTSPKKSGVRHSCMKLRINGSRLSDWKKHCTIAILKVTRTERKINAKIIIKFE